MMYHFDSQAISLRLKLKSAQEMSQNHQFVIWFHYGCGVVENSWCVPNYLYTPPCTTGWVKSLF